MGVEYDKKGYISCVMGIQIIPVGLLVVVLVVVVLVLMVDEVVVLIGVLLGFIGFVVLLGAVVV